MRGGSTYLVLTNYNGMFDAVCVGCRRLTATYVRVKQDLERWHATHHCDFPVKAQDEPRGLQLVGTD